MAKAPDAFRTISEVSDALGTPAHVLRFWESKFSQIKPVKRAGGRRYYRPDDIALLAGIKHLLHVQGMTIKGAQKLLRDRGVKHVASLVGSPIDGALESKVETPNATKKTLAPTKETATDAPEPKIAPVPQPVLVDPNTLVPQEMPDKGVPRWFGAAGKLDADALRGKSADIMPLISRLEAVRDRMRNH